MWQSSVDPRVTRPKHLLKRFVLIVVEDRVTISTDFDDERMMSSEKWRVYPLLECYSIDECHPVVWEHWHWFENEEEKPGVWSKRFEIERMAKRMMLSVVVADEMFSFSSNQFEFLFDRTFLFVEIFFVFVNEMIFKISRRWMFISKRIHWWWRDNIIGSSVERHCSTTNKSRSTTIVQWRGEIFSSMTFLAIELNFLSSMIDIQSRWMFLFFHGDARWRRRWRTDWRFFRGDGRLNSLKKIFFFLIVSISLISHSDEWCWSRRKRFGWTRWTKISKGTVDWKIQQRRTNDAQWTTKIRSIEEMTNLFFHNLFSTSKSIGTIFSSLSLNESRRTNSSWIRRSSISIVDKESSCSPFGCDIDDMKWSR